jgi:hypothetical protein
VEVQNIFFSGLRFLVSILRQLLPLRGRSATQSSLNPFGQESSSVGTKEGAEVGLKDNFDLSLETLSAVEFQSWVSF